MHSHTTAYKRLNCDVCARKTLSSVAKISGDEYALAIPPDWRLVWDKAERELKFWCDECWSTFALTLQLDDRVV